MSIEKRGITPDQKKLVHSENEHGLPYMVPDTGTNCFYQLAGQLYHVYKFKMICIIGTLVIKRKQNVEHMDRHG